MKAIKLLTVFTILTFVLSSCLTTEYKEYKWTFTGENSGTLTIKYYNIMSKADDEELSPDDEVVNDYNELMDTYINGDELENQYPDAVSVNKRLYEENGVLCGEVVIEFNDVSQVKLYKYDKKSPYMFFLESLSSETFDSSNGEKGPDYMPVVIWDPTLKILTLKTTVETPGDETTSLLKSWKKPPKKSGLGLE